MITICDPTISNPRLCRPDISATVSHLTHAQVCIYLFIYFYILLNPGAHLKRPGDDVILLQVLDYSQGYDIEASIINYKPSKF